MTRAEMKPMSHVSFVELSELFFFLSFSLSFFGFTVDASSWGRESDEAAALQAGGAGGGWVARWSVTLAGSLDRVALHCGVALRRCTGVAE